MRSIFLSRPTCFQGLAAPRTTLRLALWGLIPLALAAISPQVAPGQSVVINEIMYNQTAIDAPVSAELAEFLELHNFGPTAVNLAGWRFTQGIDFVFPGGTMLPAGGFIVLTRDIALFRQVYGNEPVLAGAFAGMTALANGGEQLTLRNAAAAAAIVDDMTYSDCGAWPQAADGNGPSLELIAPNLNNADPANWRASSVFRGTPGRANSGPPIPGDIDQDGFVGPLDMFLMLDHWTGGSGPIRRLFMKDLATPTLSYPGIGDPPKPGGGE